MYFQKQFNLLIYDLFHVDTVTNSRQYELGQTYVFRLKSDTFLNDGSAQIGQRTGRQIGYGVEAETRLTTLWKDAQAPLNRIVEIDLADAHLTVTPADKK